VRFDRGALALVLGGEFERGAERGERFVDGEAGVVGRDFKQNARGFAVINGMKIISVHHGTHAQIERLQGCERMGLGGVVGGAKCEVVNRARAGGSAREFGVNEHIDIGSGSAGGDAEARAVIGVGRGAITHRVGEERGGGRGFGHSKGDAMKTTDAICRGNFRVGGRGAGIRLGGGDQFENEAVGISKRDDFVAEARRERARCDAVGEEAYAPKIQAARGYGKRRGVGLARARTAASDAGPREKREHGARRADAVAVVEMIGGRVVEIDGAFDQAQAERACVESEVAARITRDGGDVM